jgi:3-isopropylmalate/(R)-2-methylmalate dehydratase small subunit
VKLGSSDIATLAAAGANDSALREVTVDLLAQQVRCGPHLYRFEIEAEAREMLVEGLDAIDLTLKQRTAIEAFRTRDRVARPWIYEMKPA